MPLINRARAKAYLLDAAITQGKPRLSRVSADTLDWLEGELRKKMEWLISVHPHGGPKTITPPTR